MLIFIGDVHSEFYELAHRLTVRKIRDSVLVQVGDFGVGFYEKQVEKENLAILNKTLEASNNLLYVIRGNHDDPAYFKKGQRIGNIQFVPDYSTLELEGYTVFLAGGAISIDRTSRIEGKNYWKEEEFVLDAEWLETSLKEVKKIDIVVTHNAPTEFWPFEISNLVWAYARRDDDLISHLAKEREMHSKLLKYLTGKFAPSHWYYGHYHTIVDGKYNNLKYQALGESQLLEHLDEY
jgi:UDP-2,3-diacylglucosamine pyrophosphatase LpxH